MLIISVNCCLCFSRACVRKGLRKELIKLAQDISELWAVGGDSTAILCSKEETGDRGFNEHVSVAFQRCIAACRLPDLALFITRRHLRDA